MRKVKARLLKLNEILDGDKSGSDSSSEEKAPDIKTETNPMLPPPKPPSALPPKLLPTTSSKPVPSQPRAKK
jgi:hypothetical protein